MSEGSESKQYRTLFVNGLNSKITEESLRPHFQNWGEIEECNIVRDPRTGISKGFGFITYKYANMVDIAVAAQPYYIDGREVLVRRSEPRESREFRKLFIGGLNKSTDEESLISHFKKWGEIEDCKIVRYQQTGKSNGFGFITYKYANMVNMAVAARPHIIDGHEVDAHGIGRRNNKEFRTLFICGLNKSSNEASLISHFSKWGEVNECAVVRCRRTGQSRRFGFLTYKRADMVDKAQAARPHKIDGVEVTTKRRFPRAVLGTRKAQVTVNTLYVRGIENDIGEEDLREYFGRYGNIVGINIPIDKSTGMRRGIAFVHFDDYDPVDKIVYQQLFMYKGRMLIVRKSTSSEPIWRNKEMVGFQRSEGAGDLDRYGRDGVSGGEGGPWGNGYDGSYSGANGYDASYSGDNGYDGSYPGAYGYDGNYFGAYGYSNSYPGS